MRFKVFSALLALALVPTLSRAATMTVTGSGTGTDGNVSAKAVFTTTDAGTLTIQLTNTLGADVFRSPGQALSDLQFTLSNAPGTLGSTSASGQLANIDKDTGKVTYVAGSPTRWLGSGGQGTFTINGSTILMSALGGGQPDHMLTPDIANGGTYTNVNKGVSNFNPSTIGTATFTLNLSGVTGTTTVSDVVFSFGTGPETFVSGGPSGGPPVPEPSTLVLTLCGLGSFGLARLRSRRQAVAA